MDKIFEPTDLDVLQQLNGAKISDLFFQPTEFILGHNLLVFHFTTKQRKKYALHVGCLVRIINQNKLLLTSSDEYMDVHYKALAGESDDNLLKHNIDIVFPMLSATRIADVKVTQTADVILQTENGLIIEITSDGMENGYEYYRFFRPNKSPDKAYVVYSQGGEICFYDYDWA